MAKWGITKGELPNARCRRIHRGTYCRYPFIYRHSVRVFDRQSVEVAVNYIDIVRARNAIFMGANRNAG